MVRESAARRGTLAHRPGGRKSPEGLWLSHRILLPVKAPCDEVGRVDSDRQPARSLRPLPVENPDEHLRLGGRIQIMAITRGTLEWLEF
jgi:hypothetical protein